MVDDGAAATAIAAVPGSREGRRSLGTAVAVALRAVTVAAHPDVQSLTRFQRSPGCHGQRRLHEAAKSARGAGARIAAVCTLNDDLKLGDPLRHHKRLDRWIID